MNRKAMTPPIFYFKAVLQLCCLLVFLAACKPGQGSATQVTTKPVVDHPPTQTVINVTAAPTPVPPTQEPLAATADGWEISLAEYHAELAQYRAAQGTELAPVDEQRVLQDLIDQALLASAAKENGYSVDQATLNERIQRLIDQLGGRDALDAWMQTYGYNEATFRRALERSIAAAWMRDQIAAGIPRMVEQVHARQILLYTAEQADEVMGLLKAGNDFGNLALKYDPVAHGDLGWFPRGYLLDKKLDEVVFSLQPNAYSEVVQTLAGYHILQVLERDEQRSLSPEALLALQVQAVRNWMDERRSQSQVQILLP